MTSEKKYDAKKAACWGALDWLIGKDRSTPLVDLLMRVNSDMNENLSRSFFKALQSNGNYLRIQAVVGITESEMDMHEGNTGIHERVLLISLGTGMTSEKKYDAKKAACWGALDWLIGKDR
ncbi:unnamed protein product [Prunus armeniaca]